LVIRGFENWGFDCQKAGKKPHPRRNRGGFCQGANCLLQLLCFYLHFCPRIRREAAQLVIQLLGGVLAGESWLAVLCGVSDLPEPVGPNVSMS
jgi:hypothetical protein